MIQTKKSSHAATDSKTARSQSIN